MSFFEPFAVIPLGIFALLIVLGLCWGYQKNETEFWVKQLTIASSNHRWIRRVTALLVVHASMDQNN